MFPLKKLFFSLFILIYCFGLNYAWFLNDFADERSDVISEFNERIKDLETLGTENVDSSLESSEKTRESNKNSDFASDLLSSLFHGELGFPNGLSFLKEITKQPWWKGPEVCVSKIEQVSNNSQVDVADKSPFIFLGNAAFSTCRNTLNKYICTNKIYSREETKTTEVVYQCCPGARKNHETDMCEHVDIKSFDETAKNLEASEFTQAANNYVKKSVLETPNMTIFVPSDQAVNSYVQKVPSKFTNEFVVHASPNNKTSDDSSENEISNLPEKNEKKPALSDNIVSSERMLNHFVPGVYDVHDLENEEILKTIDGLPIRVNIYHGERKPIITANCAVIKSANHPVENGGMLHVTDAILPQVTKSIKDILLESKEFGTFTEYVANAELLEKLGEAGNYTVFVVSDDAFNKLDENMKSKLAKGKSCIKTMMKAHVIPRTLCSGAFGALTVMTRSLSGNWLTIERMDNDSLQIGKDSQTTLTDIVASNGVIHLIDHPIVPRSAQPVTSLLENQNHTKWLNLMKKAGFADESDKAVNRTLFVPSEAAIKEAKLEEMDTEKLKEIVSLHISNQSVCSCEMKNNLVIPSLASDNGLRITTYETGGTLFVGLDPKIMVQCASIVVKDEKACDTMIHEVAEVLKPSSGTILEKIENDSSFSKLKHLLKNTSLYEELKNGSFGPITLLAPTEEAFSSLTEDEWKTLEDKSIADELLRRHIIKDVICCNGIGMSVWPFSEEVNTANGFSMNVRRTRSGVTFGETTTVSCDHLTKDGLIHYVDKVMMPRPINVKGHHAVKYMDASGSEVVLFGI